MDQFRGTRFEDRMRELQSRTPEEREAQRTRFWTTSRLFVPAEYRIPAATVASFVAGMSLGVAQGSQMAGLRYRAEHAHRLPNSTTGWFFYHKSKNYHTVKGGLQEGIKMGGKVAFWSTSMLLIEALFDAHTERTDLFNTILASVTVAGVFSLWNRFPLPEVARTTKTALKIGIVYGGLQDLAAMARSRKIGYVDYVQRKMRGDSELEANRTNIAS